MDDTTTTALTAPIPDRPVSNRDAVYRVGRQIKYGTTITPWMRAYAEWLILECAETPKLALRATRARGLSRSPVTYGQLRQLEQRPDFVDYCEDLRAGPLEAARAKFAARFPEYIDAHHDALKKARAANDYSAMAKIAEPVLDRVYPKKAEHTPSTQIAIVLTPQQLQGISAYAPGEVETADTETTDDTDSATH